MRKSTIAAFVLVAAAGTSHCSDNSGPVGVLPSPNPSGARFSNSTSGQSEGTATSGPVSSISRIALAMVTDDNGDSHPNVGDSITFTISTTLTWSQVTVVCSQNGDVVLRASRTPSAWSPILLKSDSWQVGSADCVATLEQVNDTKVLTLATATFIAGA
jgi:hypothetical protein